MSRTQEGRMLRPRVADGISSPPARRAPTPFHTCRCQHNKVHLCHSAASRFGVSSPTSKTWQEEAGRQQDRCSQHWRQQGQLQGRKMGLPAPPPQTESSKAHAP